ncbi:hypothetical protein [Spirillospora sp. NPDC048819]|uniref:hypothetical protein n=1 Tax=Spirillospora sp. NPDC048819 TaxID=3155268 RepID=UPI0033EBD330
MADGSAKPISKVKAGDKVLASVPGGDTATVTKVHRYTAAQVTYDLTINGLHTYYVVAGTTPLLVHNCEGLKNNRSEAMQKIELKTAADRGVRPATLSEEAGMNGLSEAIGGASDFMWRVTMEGDLKVMPAYAGGGSGEWPRAEIAHKVLAGMNGRLRSASSGTYLEGFPVFITNRSGHFTLGIETLSAGEEAFKRAGIDVIATPFER